MAITKLEHINSKKHLKYAIDYICRPEKTDCGKWIATQNCCFPYQDFIKTKHEWNKLGGRQAYHYIISFSDADQSRLSPDVTLQIISEFTERYVPDYEAVFSVHNDTDHIHGHLIYNSVNLVTGKKYHCPNGEWAKNIQPIVNDICQKYGLETLKIEAAKSENLDYGTWKKKQEGQPIENDFLRMDIDKAIDTVKSYSGNYGDFLSEIVRMGYSIRGTEISKTLSLIRPDKENGIRTYKLGDNYTVKAIKNRLGYKEELSVVPDSQPLEERIQKEKADNEELADINILQDDNVESEPELAESSTVSSSKQQPIWKVNAQLAAVSPPVVSSSIYTGLNLDQQQKKYYRILQTRYAIKIYKGRRACSPGAYIGNRSWVSRQYAMQLTSLAADYAWLVKNRPENPGKMRELRSGYAVTETELNKKRMQLNKRKQALYKQKGLLEQELYNGYPDASTLTALRNVEMELMRLRTEDIPEVKQQLQEVRQNIERAERMEQEMRQIEQQKQQVNEQKKRIERRITDGRVW